MGLLPYRFDDLIENEGIKGVRAEQKGRGEGTAVRNPTYATFSGLLNPMSNYLI
jgi:hypothetical protein